MLNRQCSYLLILIFLYTSKIAAQNADTLFLNDNWHFSEWNGQTCLKAKVPGTVHTDLLENKMIKDPFYGCNENDLQWIETKNWEYKTLFQVEENILKNEHIELVFEGLDTYAKVYLNDSLVIAADNMFFRWRADVKKYLKKGENELRVIFESASAKGKEAAAQLSYPLPGDERVFVRKAQYQFGSDFGPRMVTCGIWKPVYIDAWSHVKIESTQVLQKSLTKEKAVLKFITNVISDEDSDAEIKIEDEISGRIYHSKKIKLKKGDDHIGSVISIEDPELWWANGLGQPYLYKFKIKLCEGEKILDETMVRTGLRIIEVVNTKDVEGSSFYLKLNGIPLFIKGANYIPQNNFITEVKNDDYKDLILQAKESNFNMLRVWGGGIYENNVFYDLCDENGILVWQDLMFSMAVYPGDSAFVENVQTEVQQNVMRLRNHPCLALWCGHSETEKGWNNRGGPEQYKYIATDSAEIRNNHQKLFGKIIPEVLGKADSGRFYLHSSRDFGWGSVISDFGYQSFPELSTLQKIADQEDWVLGSETLKCHQKNPAGVQAIETNIQSEYNVPDNPDDYIYVSQLMQAYGIKTAIEDHRNAKPDCMGVLYGQFNDCWPAVSWSGIDYYHNKKALQFFVKKAYNEILVTLADHDKSISVRVISDKNVSASAQLELRLIDFNGKIRWEEKKFVNIKPGMNKIAETVDKQLILAEVAQHKSMVFIANVIVDDELVSQNLLYFVKPKDLALEDPGISYKIIKQPEGFDIELRAKHLAKNVFISFENCDSRDVQLSDNFFDMLPGTTVRIFAKTNEEPEEIVSQMHIRTLFDIR